MSAFIKRAQVTFAGKIGVNRFKSTVIANKKYILCSGALLTTAYGISSMLSVNNVLADFKMNDPMSYMNSLKDLAIKIDAESILNGFLDEKKKHNFDEDTLYEADVVIELFRQSGIEDEDLIRNLIHIMDWNENDKLTQYEVAALFTLFNVGSDVERYQFLFKCLDLDQSGSVHKGEFREILTSLLEAKYHLFGLSNPHDPDEIYFNLGNDDYHTLAKFHANQLTRKIFLFADPKRKGNLKWNAFLHWCLRGGSEVKTLKELLYQTYDESTSSELIRPYSVGRINAHQM